MSVDLEKLKQLMAAGTPPPWVSAPAYGKWPATVVQDKEMSARIICQEVPGFPNARLDEGFMADFNLIAAMRNALPDIIAELEQAREQAAGAKRS